MEETPMQTRTRALAVRREQAPVRWLLGSTALAALALGASLVAAHGQSSITPPDAPAAAQPTTPAEVQPGHGVVAPSTGSSGPQTAIPAPRPPGSGADTPGGSARSGVIAPPPAAGDAAINRGAPGAAAGTMPVIPPPGAPGGNQRVVPK